MQYDDEKDYIIRMIKEATRILFSLLLGKEYKQVILPQENKYEVSGNKLDMYKDMADQGKINEAENILLENIDYSNKDEVTAAVLFYQYISNKDSRFLKQNNYSEEEVYYGLKSLAKKAGYREVCDILE